MISFGIIFFDRVGRLNRVERSLGFDNLFLIFREEEDELILMVIRLLLIDDFLLVLNRMYVIERCEEVKEVVDIFFFI